MTENNTTEAVVYEKGSWQDSLAKSTILLDRSAKAKKAAGAHLWNGAQAAIEGWLDKSDTDVSAEGLASEVLDVLGAGRKGDASKIKTVALAVKSNGLVLASFANLSQAYTEAVKVTKTVKAEAAEDSAAEEAIEAIEAPKTTSSVEGAAALLLSKGVDGAVVAILDTLGKDNEAAHRAFMRAVSTEIAARAQARKPKPEPKVKAEKKDGATKAKKAPTTKAKVATTKAKPVPVSASKGDPNKKALPAKAKPVPVTSPVEETVEETVEAPAKAKPRPARRPVRR